MKPDVVLVNATINVRPSCLALACHISLIKHKILGLVR